MKYKFIFTLLATLSSLSAFANCEKTVENAALEMAAEQSATDSDGLYFNAETELDETNGNTFTYSVYVMPGYADGGSTHEFEPMNFLVIAVGNANRCKVEQITLLN
jgi:hypothetical protein